MCERYYIMLQDIADPLEKEYLGIFYLPFDESDRLPKRTMDLFFITVQKTSDRDDGLRRTGTSIWQAMFNNTIEASDWGRSPPRCGAVSNNLYFSMSFINPASPLNVLYRSFCFLDTYLVHRVRSLGVTRSTKRG